ncbi:hypothetical protein FUAX_41620 (plasmid) [Fulvitalea axinellae]|uniref:DUF6377 domain-containing protein n=1 Tax=Fulvitalea axinellae TaxID=1182444 RepID=A0AAU9DGP3_9BACT|nr:hypothetical protein FUAX_41620 [Fulvitalea axinellae]
MWGWVLIIAGIIFGNHDKSSEETFSVLDQTLERKANYDKAYSNKIDSLIAEIDHEQSPLNLYKEFLNISDLYLHFNADSALAYSIKAARQTPFLNNEREHVNGILHLANAHLHAGLINEAASYLKFARERIKDKSLLPTFFSYQLEYQQALLGYRPPKTLQEMYSYQIKAYRDSLVQALPEGSNEVTKYQAESLLEQGLTAQARSLLQTALKRIDPQDEIYPDLTYLIAQSYSQSGDIPLYKEFLALSATQNIKMAHKDNPALRELATQLYNEGNTAKAYEYIKHAHANAIESRIKVSSYPVWETFSILTKSNEKLLRTQSYNRLLLLSLSAVIATVLSVGVFFLRRQASKLKESNTSLESLSEELKQKQKQIEKTNSQLTQLSQVQKQHIVHYLQLCSDYIGKIDEYRLGLFRIAKRSQKEQLLQNLKSTEIIDTELKSFYRDFDKSFLAIYPDFIEEYNKLLLPEEHISPKKGELMNAELRIFALVLLGIPESARIASFLRYSPSTIYNYRTKAKNRFKGDRDDFEQKVMEIGRKS